MIPGHKVADGRDVERRGVKDESHAVSGAEPENQITERVEEREDAEHAVSAVYMQHLAGGFDVRIDAEMREHHAFRFAGAAAAEDDGGQIIHGRAFGLSTGQFDDPNGCEQGEQHGEEFLPAGDAFRNVFQPEQTHTVRYLQLGLFHEQTAGHDRPKACLFDGRFEPDPSDGVVQVHARPAAQCRCDVHQGARDARREKEADVRLPVPMRLEHAGERDRAGQGLPARHARL